MYTSIDVRFIDLRRNMEIIGTKLPMRCQSINGDDKNAATRVENAFPAYERQEGIYLGARAGTVQTTRGTRYNVCVASEDLIERSGMCIPSA